MATIDRADIFCYEISGKIVCKDCIEDDEEVSEDDIFWYDDKVDKEEYFCDRCGKLIH